MKRVLWTYVGALHLALLACFLHPGVIETQRARLGFQPHGMAYIESMRALHARGDALIPEGAAIFLGDSLTQGLPVSAVTDRAVNYGIGYQTTAQLIESVKGYESLKRARVIYLNIGTGDVRDGEADRLPDRYRTLLAALPEVPLVWSGIIPRLPEHAAAIRTANAAARRLCEAREGCRFVDTWSLANGDGGGKRDLYEPDRVHLNADGYQHWIGLLP